MNIALPLHKLFTPQILGVFYVWQTISTPPNQTNRSFSLKVNEKTRNVSLNWFHGHWFCFSVIFSEASYVTPLSWYPLQLFSSRRTMYTLLRLSWIPHIRQLTDWHWPGKFLVITLTGKWNRKCAKPTYPLTDRVLVFWLTYCSENCINYWYGKYSQIVLSLFYLFTELCRFQSHASCSFFVVNFVSQFNRVNLKFPCTSSLDRRFEIAAKSRLKSQQKIAAKIAAKIASVNDCNI